MIVFAIACAASSALCAAHLHLDQLRRAFAVACNRFGQHFANILEAGCESCPIRVSCMQLSLPAKPLAIATSMSFVLVSPSTVIILNVRSVA